MKQYRLFALKVNGDSLVLAARENFSRVTSDYVLVYTINEVKGGVEITDEHIDRLSEAEREWLQSCNKIIIGEETKIHADTIATNVMAKLQELDELLAQEMNNMA